MCRVPRALSVVVWCICAGLEPHEERVSTRHNMGDLAGVVKN